MYARGILFGKMKYELGDHSYVRCPENNLVADIEFKTKGYFTGGYNIISGTIKNEQTQQVLYELSGMWSGEMFIKDVVVRCTSDCTMPVSFRCCAASFRHADLSMAYRLATGSSCSMPQMQSTHRQL